MEKKFKFKHGVEVRDIITGHKGVIAGRADYITGCNQYDVVSKEKPGSPARSGWYDEDRLVLTKAKRIVIKLGKLPGGPVSNPAPSKG